MSPKSHFEAVRTYTGALARGRRTIQRPAYNPAAGPLSRDRRTISLEIGALSNASRALASSSQGMSRARFHRAEGV